MLAARGQRVLEDNHQVRQHSRLSCDAARRTRQQSDHLCLHAKLTLTTRRGLCQHTARLLLQRTRHLP